MALSGIYSIEFIQNFIDSYEEDLDPKYHDLKREIIEVEQVPKKGNRNYEKRNNGKMQVNKPSGKYGKLKQKQDFPE